MDRLKLLITAYACEPRLGSEPGVGWNWVNQIAQFHDVWVVTRANNRPSIVGNSSDYTNKALHWAYFDLPRWARFWKKGARGSHLYYYLWQIGAYRIATTLHKQIGFDAAHHLTFTNYWMPAFTSFMPLPFFWGPLGGGDSTPSPLAGSLSRRGRAYEMLRDLAVGIGDRDPLVRHTACRAALTMVKTKETGAKVGMLGARDVIMHPDCLLSPSDFHSLRNLPYARSKTPFRFLSIGRLLHWKGFHLGLLAFAKARAISPESEYWIVGSGPESDTLRRMAMNLGIGESVHFWGQQPRDKVLSLIAQSHALIHPSLHDSGAWACIEAMAAGRPVVGLDVGGLSEQATADTGIKVQVRQFNQVVSDLADGMRSLMQDPESCFNLGRRASDRIACEYTWEARATRVAELYYRTSPTAAD